MIDNRGLLWNQINGAHGILMKSSLCYLKSIVDLNLVINNYSIDSNSKVVNNRGWMRNFNVIL